MEIRALADARDCCQNASKWFRISAVVRRGDGSVL